MSQLVLIKLVMVTHLLDHDLVLEQSPENIVRDIIINSQLFSMIFTLFGQFLVLD